MTSVDDKQAVASPPPSQVEEEISHLESLHSVLRRRRRVLEFKRAYYNPGAVPPEIPLELEDIDRSLVRCEADLRRLRPRRYNAPNPYLGLLPFQEDHADRFFGRDALVADLVARVSKTPFLAVLGPSGSGKSSVVRAGLLAQLKEGALPGSDGWGYITMKPGGRPLNVLATDLANLQRGRLGDARHILTQLSQDDGLLLAADMMFAGQHSRRLVVTVDQFEEVWTLAPEATREQFINLLLTASRAPDTPLLVVLTMRADFLHRAAEHSALAAAIAEHDVIVSPMQADELRAVIERPADVNGSFEPGLVDELVGRTLGRQGTLPLLEDTLQELWKRRNNDGTMTWSAYRELGGLEGALSNRADAILNTQTTEQQEELRRLFLRLVQPGEGVADTRRRVALDELVFAGTTLAAVQTLLTPLINERLLTVGRDEASGTATMEIAHEALIQSWQRLHQWVEASREALRIQHQLSEDTRAWRDNGHNDSYLYSGRRLARVQEAIPPPDRNELEREFLAACEKRERKQQRDRYFAQADLWEAKAKSDSSYLYQGSQLVEVQKWADEHPDYLEPIDYNFLQFCHKEQRKREEADERTRYRGQTAGGAVGAGLGYGLAFALQVIVESVNRSQLGDAVFGRAFLAFLSLTPIGGLVGLCIGLALTHWRQGPAIRMIGSMSIGALTGCIAYLAFIRFALSSTLVLDHALAGALFGAGIGLGAGLPQFTQHQIADMVNHYSAGTAIKRKGQTLAASIKANLLLIGPTIGGMLGVLAAYLTGALQWPLWSALISGFLLGSLTGAGFFLTAAERRSVEEVGHAGTR